MVDCQWQLKFTKQAQKDAKKLAAAGLKPKAQGLLEILRQNPFTSPPSYEKLLGDLKGVYSRRINVQHRLVYEVIESQHTIKIIRMWSHYGE
ncbi:MAG: Txe/YoeB family addiction module toxin [Hydrococcus sp. SU_1_0]|nr:Txe/YoeB family addiction module toxin [Hydrococcus sp. SU_1_0]